MIEEKELQKMEEEKEYAGFWRRLAANLLDGIIISVPLGIIVGLIMTGQMFPPSELGDPVQLNMWVSDSLYALYGLIVPVLWLGFTLGKHIMGIRIVRVDGKKVGIGTMLMRNVVASIAYVFTLGILLIVSLVMAVAREDKRTVHDFIAGTAVEKVK